MRRPRGRGSSTSRPQQIMAAEQPSSPPPPLSRRSRKRRRFSEEEDDLLLKLHALLGNRWSLIAGRLPGRTDSEVMNHWNSNLNKRMAAATHQPSSLLSDDHRRRRCCHCRRHLRSEENNPGRHSSSSPKKDEIPGVGDGDDCTVSDATSCNGDRDNHRVATELNLELTLSTPCITPINL